IGADLAHEGLVGHHDPRHAHAGCGVRWNAPEIRRDLLDVHHSPERRPQVAVTGERRHVHASPISATSTPTTLASCGTRKLPRQKLWSRNASIAKRPIE